MVSASKSRTQYYDFVRGIAIMMVVAIHTFKIPKDISVDLSISTCIRQVFNTAVPLFLVISGYFLGRKDLSTSEKRWAFWKKQILKVYIPGVIWSLPPFVVCIMNAINGRSSVIVEVIKLLVLWHSYFVALIIECYIVLPFLKRNCAWLCAFIIMSMTTSIIVVSAKLHLLPIFIYAGHLPFFGAFFYIGYYLSDKQRNYSLLFPILLIIIGLVASYFETLWLVDYSGKGFGYKPSSFIYSYGFVLIAFHKKVEQAFRSNWFTNSIVFVGLVSFNIYLSNSHLQQALKHITIYYNQPWMVRWLILMCVTIILSIVLIKITPKKYQKYWGLP